MVCHGLPHGCGVCARMSCHVMSCHVISHLVMMSCIGPPGTGKTLIAPQIAELIGRQGKVQPRVVNGPEVSVGSRVGWGVGVGAGAMHPWSHVRWSRYMSRP